MKIFWVLYLKELKESFGSSSIYVISGLFCFLMGALFYNYVGMTKNLNSGNLGMNILVPLYGNMNFVFLFIAPMLTMRLFIEEKSNQTLDLLTIARVQDYQLLLSKFIASSTVALFMLLPTFIFPLILAAAGYKEWGIVFSAYAGTYLSILSYLAVGLFCSVVTDNQIISALLSFTILMALMLLVILAQMTENYLVVQMVSYISVPFHYEGFVRGVIRTYDLVYYVSFIGMFIYLAQKVLEGRKYE